jgi:D-alanine-D-alanine ligase
MINKNINKTKIGLVFGGKSGEHEVSVRSAMAIRKILNLKYKVLDIMIDKSGKFDLDLVKKAQVIFPIVHGSFGEDGCLQGLLEMLDKPYVGAGVLGSAVGMDKDIQKRLLIQSDIPVTKYQIIKKGEIIEVDNYPVFVKPANSGSSVGISKCKNKNELTRAIKNAFMYDTKVLIEVAIEGRELEISVLGNEEPIASVPGEIIPRGKHKFYDYDAKYIDENGAELVIPAKLSTKKIKEIKSLAIRTYKILECCGMARVDIFLRPDGKVVINEINTIPGFTDISMYPKLWKVSGLPYPKLLDRLIELAIEKKREKDKLKRSFS